MIRFCHQKLLVSDLERAIAFYEEQFELKVLARMTSGGGEKMAWLGYGGAGDFFLELGEGTPAPGGQHIAFVTDARDEFHRRHAPWIDSEVPELGIYFLHDCDGNAIEVMPAAAVKALGGQ